MKAIVKDNSNNILFRIKEDAKSCLSILMGKTEEFSRDSLDDYETSDYETVQALKESEKKINKVATEYESSIGIPSQSKKKNIAKTTSKRVVEPKANFINPIINRTTNTDRNISLIKGFDNER